MISLASVSVLLLSGLLLLASTSIITFSPLVILPVVLCLLVQFLIKKRYSISRIIEFVLCFNIIFLFFYFPVFGWILSGSNEIDIILVMGAVGVRSILVSGVLSLIAFYILFKRSNSYAVIVFFIYVLYFGISALLTQAGIVARGGALMNTLIPLLLLPMAFKYVIQNDANQKKYEFILIVLWVMFFVGFLYYLLLPYIYDLVRPDLIGIIRSNDGEVLNYGEYPGSWYSRIGSFEFRRFSGSAPDPIVWGYFLALFSTFYYYKKSYVLAIFFMVFIVLSGSKGALLFLIVVISLNVALRMNSYLFYMVSAGWLALSIALAYLVDSSGRVHFQGLVGGFLSITNSIESFLFGYGVGSGGNLVRLTNQQFIDDRSVWLNSGAESGIGVLLYQYGLVGFMLIALAYLSLFRAVSQKMTSLKFAIWPIIMATIINSFLQENMVNLSVLGLVFIFMILIYRMRFQR